MPAEEKIELLKDAFELFSESSARLERSHQELRERVRELSEELRQKNLELSARVEEIDSLRKHLEQILESITDGVVAVDRAFRFTAVNPAARALLRLPPETNSLNAAEGLSQASSVLAELLQDTMYRERPHLGVECALASPGELGPVGSEKVVSVSTAVIRGESGEVLGAVECFSDLTERRGLETALRRKDRLTALGEMASVLAHEIRNPLGGMTLAGSLLSRSPQLGDSERGLLDKILSGVSLLNRLVEEMLDFTREFKLQKRRWPLSSVVQAATALLGTEMERKGIRLSLAGPEIYVQADAELLSRAFLNLLRNALEAMSEGGILAIQARELGEEMELTFSDTGLGLAPQVMERLFQPFATFRPRGTGLGLVIVQRIVEAHGGTVSAHNNPVPPGGASFIVRLPLSAECGARSAE